MNNEQAKLGSRKGVDYCRSCAVIGKLDADGWCERCCYRNVLDIIASDRITDPVVRDMATEVLQAWETDNEAFAKEPVVYASGGVHGTHSID